MGGVYAKFSQDKSEAFGLGKVSDPPRQDKSWRELAGATHKRQFCEVASESEATSELACNAAHSAK